MKFPRLIEGHGAALQNDCASVASIETCHVLYYILTACAGLFCLVAGTFKCFGILKLQIEQEFDECPAGVPLWIASATSVVSLLAGKCNDDDDG